MTGFVPPQDPRLVVESPMVRVRGKELPGSLEELREGDPDRANGTHRITFRSTPVDSGNVIEVVGTGLFVVTDVYDPYKGNPDRSMRGRFIAAVANPKGA